MLTRKESMHAVFLTRTDRMYTEEITVTLQVIYFSSSENGRYAEFGITVIFGNPKTADTVL